MVILLRMGMILRKMPFLELYRVYGAMMMIVMGDDDGNG